MLRIFVNGLGRRALDDFSAIHHEHLIADVLTETEKIYMQEYKTKSETEV